LKEVNAFLGEKGYAYDSHFRKESGDTVDFFRSDSRITIVKLVDKYQVMVYDGKMIQRSDQPTEHFVVEYLKGIL
jgi:hypothetical protein